MRPFESKASDVELYIGKNAGRRIDWFIENAKHDIRIISPYTVESKVEALIKKSQNGVEVRLLTSHDPRHFKNPATSKLLRKFIVQERHTNEKRKKIHRFLEIFAPILFTSTLVFLSISILMSSLLVTVENQVTMYPSVGLVLLAFILLTTAKRIKVYTYSYDSPFPVKFVVERKDMTRYEKEQFKDNAFFHVKLFIFDDEIAFLGSVNLTEKGMRHNVESLVTISQKDKVNSLIAYFDETFSARYLQRSLDNCGNRIYPEPRN